MPVKTNFNDIFPEIISSPASSSQTNFNDVFPEMTTPKAKPQKQRLEQPPVMQPPPEEPPSEFAENIRNIWQKPLETLPKMALKSQETLFPMLGAIRGIRKVLSTPQATPLQKTMEFVGEASPYMPPLRDPLMAGIPGGIHAAATGQPILKAAIESTMTAPQPVAEFPLPWSPPPTEGKRYDWKRLLTEAHTLIRPDASEAEKKALYTLGSTLNLVSDPYMWGLEQGLVKAIEARSLPEIVKYTNEAINMAKGMKKKPGAMPEMGVGQPELLPLGDVKAKLEAMPPPIRPSVTIARPPFSEAGTALKGKKPSPPTVLPPKSPIPLPGEVAKQPLGVIERPQLMPPAISQGGGEFSPFMPPRIPEQKLLQPPPPPPPPIQLPRPATLGAIPRLKPMPKYVEKPPSPPEPPPKGRMVSDIPILGGRPPEPPALGIVVPGKKAGAPGKIGIYGSTPKLKPPVPPKPPPVPAKPPEPPPLPKKADNLDFLKDVKAEDEQRYFGTKVKWRDADGDIQISKLHDVKSRGDVLEVEDMRPGVQEQFPGHTIRIYKKDVVDVVEFVDRGTKKPSSPIAETIKPVKEKATLPTDYDLIDDYKYRGIDPQSAWSEFVRDKNLNPGMDMKDFVRLYKNASPRRWEGRSLPPPIAPKAETTGEPLGLSSTSNPEKLTVKTPRPLTKAQESALKNFYKEGGNEYLSKEDIPKIRKIGNLEVGVEDANGNMAYMGIEDFVKLSENPAFEDRMRTVILRPGTVNPEFKVKNKEWMRGLNPQNLLEKGSREAPKSLILEPIDGVKLSSNSTVSGVQKNKFVAAVGDPDLRGLIKENGIKEIIIEPPYKFFGGQDGYIDGKNIYINADVVDPYNLILHELGHAKFEGLPRIQQDAILDKLKNSRNPEIVNLIKNLRERGFMGDRVYKEIASDQMYGTKDPYIGAFSTIEKPSKSKAAPPPPRVEAGKVKYNTGNVLDFYEGGIKTEPEVLEYLKKGGYVDPQGVVTEKGYKLLVRRHPITYASTDAKQLRINALNRAEIEAAPPPTPPEAVPKGEISEYEKYAQERFKIAIRNNKVDKKVAYSAWDYGNESLVVNIGGDRVNRTKFKLSLEEALQREIEPWREGYKITHKEAEILSIPLTDIPGKKASFATLDEILKQRAKPSPPSPVKETLSAKPEGVIATLKESLSGKTKQPGIFSGTVGGTMASPYKALKLAGTRAFRKAESAGKAVVQRLEDAMVDVYTTVKKGASEADARYDVRNFFAGEKAARTPELHQAAETAWNQIKKIPEFEKNFRKVTTEYIDPKTGKPAIFDSTQQYRMWEYTTGKISKADAMANVAKDPFEKVLIGRAKKVRTLLDELGLEQVDMDLMTEKAYFRRIGKYLPRLYEMHEAGLYEKMLKKWGVHQPTETFQGNGLKLDIQGYKNRHDNWGIRYKVKGEPEKSWRIGDPLDGTFDAIGGRKEALAYVRNLKKTYGRDLKIIERWKPLTEQQRLAMGEIRRVDYPTAVAIVRGKTNLAVKGFLDFVELKGEAHGLFSKQEVPWMKQLPNNKRFGTLAGKWVSAEVADALGQFGIMEPRFLTKFTNFMQRIYSPWRKWKVVYDPAVHMANIMSNGIAMDIFGHNPFSTTLHGLKSYRLQDAWHKAADSINLFSGTFAKNELGTLEKFYAGVKPPKSGIVGHLDNVMNKARDLDAWTQTTYSAEEEVAKLGIFKNVLEKTFKIAEKDLPGLTATETGKKMLREAANEANYIMIDYKNRPGLVKLWSNMPIVGSPFLTYYFYMIPRMAKATIGIGRTGFDPMIALRAWKYPAMFGAVDAMSTAYLGLNKEEKAKVRANFPPYMQGTLEKGLQKIGSTAFPLMPFKSEYRDINTGELKKEYAVLPTTRITPWGSTMLGEKQGGMKWAGGDPLHNLYDAIYVTNKDAFTGIEISKPFAKHPALDQLNYAVRQISPSLYPGGYSFNKIWNSLVGKEDYAGRIRNPAMAFTDALLALKIQPVNVEREYQKRLRKVDADIIEIKTQLTELSKAQTRRGWDETDLKVEWKRLQDIMAQKAIDRANIILTAPLTAEGKRSTGKPGKFFPKNRKPPGFYTKPELPPPPRPRLSIPPPPSKRNFGGIPSPPSLR